MLLKHRLCHVCRLLLHRQSSKLLLKLLLALSKEDACHLQLLQQAWVHIIGLLVKRGWSEHLLWQRVHLLSSPDGSCVLLMSRHVESSADGSLRSVLGVVVPLISPTRCGQATHGVLSLVVRSGCRNAWCLRLSAQTGKEVRTTGSWSWSSRIFSGHLRQGHAQTLRIET